METQSTETKWLKETSQFCKLAFFFLIFPNWLAAGWPASIFSWVRQASVVWSLLLWSLNTYWQRDVTREGQGIMKCDMCDAQFPV